MSFYHREYITVFVRISQFGYPDLDFVSRDFDTPSSSSSDTRIRAIGERQSANKEGKALVPTSQAIELRWIWERGVEDRAKRRTCQNSNGPHSTSPTDGKAARSTTIKPSPRVPLAVSPSHHGISVYRGERTMRWVPLQSSSTGVPRRPQGSQGEGTSHAPAMSEESTPLRRGVHTLTRPISIRG